MPKIPGRANAVFDSMLLTGFHMSPMISESLPVIIEEEHLRRILLVSKHRQWSSPMSTTCENLALLTCSKTRSFLAIGGSRTAKCSKYLCKSIRFGI